MKLLSEIFHPIFELFAALIAFFYSLVPNYALAITLLTLVVMLITLPLTVKSTRSMFAMQKLGPELKRIQQKYKDDRQKQSEELMALYREHGISPLGGCLPMLLQLPIFFILYDVILGLTHMSGGKHPHPQPMYISSHSRLYHDLISQHGKMMAFGFDLAEKALSHHSSFLAALPFWITVALAIGLQYLQMRQLNGRNNAAAQMNAQMQAMQKWMPLIFGIIYINIAAGVNLYFIVSSVFRIGVQEIMYRKNPELFSGGTSQTSSLVKDKEGAVTTTPSTSVTRSTKRNSPSSTAAHDSKKSLDRTSPVEKTSTKQQKNTTARKPKINQPRTISSEVNIAESNNNPNNSQSTSFTLSTNTRKSRDSSEYRAITQSKGSPERREGNAPRKRKRSK